MLIIFINIFIVNIKTIKMQSCYVRGLSIPSNTIPSNEDDPIICLDIDCSWPFGPMCANCQFSLLAREKVPQDQTDKQLQHWLEEEIAGLLGADIEENIRQEHQKELDGINASLQEDPDVEDQCLNSGRVGRWLSELFLNTLDGQLQNKIFIGGADFENPVATDCPHCYITLDDDQFRHLHLLNCEFAHKEAEEMEKLRIGRERAERRKQRKERFRERFLVKPAFLETR